MPFRYKREHKRNLVAAVCNMRCGFTLVRARFHNERGIEYSLLFYGFFVSLSARLDFKRLRSIKETENVSFTVAVETSRKSFHSWLRMHCNIRFDSSEDLQSQRSVVYCFQ